MNTAKDKIYIKHQKVMFYALLLLAFSLPLSEAIKNLAMIAFILVGIYSTFKRVIIPKLDFLNVLILLIPLMITIGSYFSIDIENSLKGVNSILTMGILFIYVREISWNEDKISTFMISLSLGFILTLLWGYYDLYYNGKTYLELHSVGHVNHSSIYMLLIFIISFVYLFINYNNLTYMKRILFLLVLITSIISVFITGSRATMYTSLGIILLFGIYSGFKLNKKILIGILLILSLIVVLFAIGVDSRMISKFEKGVFNNAPRVDLVIGFFNTWLNNNLFFGIGINNCGIVELKEYYPQSMFNSMSHAHNTYITYLVERGIIGLLLYILFSFYLLYVLVKELVKDYKNSILLISVLIWIANIIISLANTTFHHENAILMLTIWAIALQSINPEYQKNDLKRY